MVNKRNISAIEQAHFVDLEDDKLLDLLGFLHEEVKNIEERLKADEEIQRKEEELKALKAERYVDGQKAIKLKLRAVRAVAKARGLQFNLPKESYEG